GTDTGPSAGSSGLPPAHSRPAATGRWRWAATTGNGGTMFKRRFLAASLAACGALLIAACGSGSNNASNSGPIKVGITGPFTGPYADPGIAIRNAGELAVADINTAGGINGRQLQAVNADDACDAQQGVQAAQKLLTQKIIAIVGGYCSGASIPESDTLHRNGDLPFITAASSNPKFTDQGYDNVFRMVSRDDAEAPADVSFMQQWLKASKIAIMHDNTTYAKGVADSAKQSAEAAGMTVTYFDAITPGQKDYTAALVKVGTGHPDVLFYTGYYPEFGLLAKEYVALSPSYKLNGDSACADPSVIKVAGTAVTNAGVTINTLPTARRPSSSPSTRWAAHRSSSRSRSARAAPGWHPLRKSDLNQKVGLRAPPFLCFQPPATDSKPPK